jgi:hypothetical protein
LIAKSLILKSNRSWLRGTDLNRRPQGYEPCELPGCSTPRFYILFFNLFNFFTLLMFS